MGASSGGYRFTVQHKINAVDESIVHGGGACPGKSYFFSTDVTCATGTCDGHKQV